MAKPQRTVFKGKVREEINYEGAKPPSKAAQEPQVTSHIFLLWDQEEEELVARDEVWVVYCFDRQA